MKYRVKTEQTAKFPPMYVFAPGAGGESPEPQANIDYTKVPAFTLASRGVRAINFVDVDVYLQALDGLTTPALGFGFVSASNMVVHGVASTPMQFEASAGVFVSTNAADPLVTTVQSVSGNATNTVAATLSVVEDAVAVAKAKAQIAEARNAAAGGDLRGSYRLVYRGLDELFRRGKWHDVSAELSNLCDAQFPASFGIGSLRFASPAASRIPKWNEILTKLVLSARAQGLDVGKTMRGLVDINGAV